VLKEGKSDGKRKKKNLKIQGRRGDGRKEKKNSLNRPEILVR